MRFVACGKRRKALGGGGATTDWTDNANWGAGIGSGNWVFGGAQVADLPSTDPIVCTFSNAVAISSGVWIQNGSKANVVWQTSENADEGAGLKTTWGTNNSLNIGTDTHGGLTIESGVYYMPKQLWIGNGAADSYFTLNGGVFTNHSYTCIGYGAHNRTATMTVNGGTFRQNDGTFIVGQGNHSGCKGVFNLISGSVDTAANATCSENQGTSEMNISGGSFRVGGELMLAEGRSGTATTTMDISGGSIKVVGLSRAAVGSNSSATITMSNGEFDTDNEFVLGCANGSTAAMTLSGGTFTPKKLWIGSRYDSDNKTYGTSTATFTMTGGTLATDNDQDIVVGGRVNAVGTFNMQGGTVNCGQTFHIAWNGSGTVNMSGGDIYLRSGKNLYFAEHGTSATMNFTGGTIHTDNIVMGTGDSGNATTSLTVNGGSFAPVTAKADWLSGVTVSVGANGIGFDTDGHATTFAGTIVNADGVTGNVPLMKKGTGTLTVPLDLDLARTFKFVIDGGVGPIALTGEGNTLGEGKKISVALDPVEAEMNTPYVLLTGLDASYTKEDNFALPSNNGFYAYTWTLESGTLSVSLAYSENAPVTARYGSDAWKFYDGNNTFIENAEPLAWTTYIFTGVEPAGDLETIGVGHKVVLEAAKDGDAGVTNTFNVAYVANAKDVTVTSEEGCAVRLLGADESSLSAWKFTNNGTLILAGTVSAPSLTIGGTGRIVVENGAVVTIEAEHAQPTEIELGGTMKLSKPQVIVAPFSGYGTLSLSGGSFSVWSATPFGSFNDGAFKGVLELCAGVSLEDHKGGLGSAQVRMKGASLRFGNDGDAETYCSNDFEIFEGTTNTVYANKANMYMDGQLKGSGTVLFKTDNQRGPRLRGDVSQFEGVCTIGIGKIQNSVDSGFFNSAKGSENATWILSANGTEWYGKLGSNSTYAMGDGNSTIMKFGALQQTGANAYMTPRGNNMTMEIGNLQFGESVLNGKFAYKACTFRKLGATSWLTLGQGFAAVAGSTFDFSAGGICFNLPAGETEPTSLMGHTVTFDPSVKIRVAMTQAQYEALDLNEEYLVAKLPTNPGYKPETELLVDGTVLDTPAAAKWGVRFKSFPAVDDTPSYVGAVLCRKTRGLIIVFR